MTRSEISPQGREWLGVGVAALELVCEVVSALNGPEVTAIHRRMKRVREKVIGRDALGTLDVQANLSGNLALTAQAETQSAVLTVQRISSHPPTAPLRPDASKGHHRPRRRDGFDNRSHRGSFATCAFD